MPGHDHCCVPQCTSRRDKSSGLSFHHFPNVSELRKRWLVAIRRDKGPSFRVTPNTVVCGKHFAPNDFSTGGRQGSGKPQGEDVHVVTTKRLKRGAIPSIFPFKPAASARPAPSQRQFVLSTASSLAAASKPTSTSSSLTSANEEDLVPRFSYANLIRSEQRHVKERRVGASDLQFYTGFCEDEFEMLWKFLDAANNIKRSEQVEDNEL